MLYDGLDYPTKIMIESLCNGSFTSKTVNDAWQFFEVVAENTLEWEPINVKQPTSTTTTTNKGGMNRFNPNFETDVKITSVMRRLEALELNQGAQSSVPEPSKPVVSPICVLCDSCRLSKND